MCRCLKCKSTEDISRHHLLPKMFGTYLRYKGPNSEFFNRTRVFKTVALCRECHDDYERYADELKRNVCVHLNLPYGGNEYVIDRDLNKLRSYAHEYFHKRTTPEQKERIRNIFKSILNVAQVTRRLIKRFKKLVFKYVNPMYKKFKDVMPTIDRDNFIALWRNDFHQWLIYT